MQLAVTSIPDSAVFEAELSKGVALWDVSALLPRQQPKPGKPAKHWESRPVADICRVFVHHSGKLGAAGYQGAVHSAQYEIDANQWPGGAYHFWIPSLNLLDSDDRLVVLRMQPDATRCYHTGGAANGNGLGVALQGNTTEAPLTHSHVECLEALLPWLQKQHNLRGEWLSWHSDSKRFGGTGKPTCPGKHAVDWLRAYRDGLGEAAQ